MSQAPIYRDAPVPDTFRHGLEFQDFVCLELTKAGVILQNIASKKYQFEVGENLQGFEIKLDRRCTDTGRLSIEVAEKSNRSVAVWTPSGIYRDDNSWIYIQGNYKKFWMFSKRWLRRYVERMNPRPPIKEFNGTVRRFFLGLDVAEEGCIRSWDAASGVSQLKLAYEPDTA